MACTTLHRSLAERVLEWRLGTLFWIVLSIFGFQCLSTSVSSAVSTNKYRPIILVHGVLSASTNLDDLKKTILEVHPGTNISSIPLYEDSKSLEPLWSQVPAFIVAMRPIMKRATHGVILICYSQGGIICRGILETMPDHNVHTFISLSSPQMGQYGDTSTFPYLPQLREDVYKVCYNSIGQFISVCDYWNDPHQRAKYLTGNTYLPVLNNETAIGKSKAWKSNFLRLKNLIMIGGPDDGVITPWQSSHFGFYDANEKVVEMKDQEVYKKDLFGLQTLDKQQGLKTYSIPGVTHLNWHGNRTVFNCCIEQWLT